MEVRVCANQALASEMARTPARWPEVCFMAFPFALSAARASDF